MDGVDAVYLAIVVVVLCIVFDVLRGELIMTGEEQSGSVDFSDRN